MGDLLSNISSQLHKDHISSSGDNQENDSVDNQTSDSADGSVTTDAPTIESGGQITTVTKDGPVTKVHVRMYQPVGDPIDAESGMVPGMEDKDVYDQAMGMSFDDIASKMKERLSDLLKGNTPDSLKGLLDAPWLNGQNEEGYQDGMGEDIPEEVEDMSDSKLFPAKALSTPPEIEGGFTWGASVDETFIRLAADLCVVNNMIKAASENPNSVSKQQLLAMIDPSRYEDLDEELQNELVNLYAGVLSDDFGIKEASTSVQKMQKRAYQIVGEPEYLNNDDRRRRDGAMPPNYEEWLRNVGESHHRAFSRLEEVVNPDTEVMKLRIPDGERSNPIRRELAGTEVRMRRADLNDTANSPKDSFEKKLEGDGPSAHRGTEDNTYEDKLDKKRGTGEVVGSLEQRLDERRKSKDLKSTEAEMEDAKLRQYQGFNQTVDSLLNDWRKEHKDMLKQASTDRKMIPTSIILSSPNLNGLDIAEDIPMGVMEDGLPEMDMAEEGRGPGFESIERMMQGPKPKPQRDSLERLVEKLADEVYGLKEKLTYHQNPEGVDMPSTAQDAAAGAPNVVMGPDLAVPPNENGWNSFVGNTEKPVSPKPAK
jgi:hypothetical protein